MIKKTFIKGLRKVVPITLTIYIIVGLFIRVDQWLQPYIAKWFDITIPGLGFAVLVILVFVVGLFPSKYISKRLSAVVKKIPLINDIYVPLKDVTLMMLDKNKKTFKEVVMVEFPMAGVKSLGFVTNENEIYTTIMIPTTPNPSNGFLIFVEDKTKYTVLDMTVKEGLTKVLQMGTVSK